MLIKVAFTHKDVPVIMKEYLWKSGRHQLSRELAVFPTGINIIA
jgi:hypothetical protein